MKKYFLFIVGISFILLNSCESSSEEKKTKLEGQLKESNYERRISNIPLLFSEINEDIPISDCYYFYILQTNICNACNIEVLSAVKKAKPNHGKLVFFLASDDKKIIKVLSSNPDAVIITDIHGLLKKYNLNFLKSIYSNICYGKLIEWKFI